MNRVYNELCKVMITDKPKQEEEEINQPTLLSIHSLHEDFNQEESIQVLEDSKQTEGDDICILHPYSLLIL